MTAKSPLQPGQFVWCNFPIRERPAEPGPGRHIAYEIDVLRKGDRLMVCAALYTTTTPWPRDRAIPPGVVPIAADTARRLGQNPFVVDARRIAYMPVDDRFFPDLARPDRGVRGTAPRALQNQIVRAVIGLLQRPDLLELLGPERPGVSRPPRGRRRG